MPTGFEVSPHLASALAATSKRVSLIASEDIVDTSGVKLWSKNQPITHSLQQRLLERKLRRPLEACLRAENGVTSAVLTGELVRELEESNTFKVTVGDDVGTILGELSHLVIDPSVQVLMTAMQETRPRLFRHSVISLALAGCIQAAASSSIYDLRLAMLVGLLHDIGDMYLDPELLRDDARWTQSEFRQSVIHPRLGEVLLHGLTDYPGVLAQAVGQHHERLDGTGYPRGIAGRDIGALGRLAQVVEVTVGASGGFAGGGDDPSVALRLMPGELDNGMSAAAHSIVRRLATTNVEAPAPSRPDLFIAVQGIHEKHARAAAAARGLAGDRALTQRVRDTAASAVLRLDKIRDALVRAGLWRLDAMTPVEGPTPEVAGVVKELQWRLKRLPRDCLWQQGDLTAGELTALSAIWGELELP